MNLPNAIKYAFRRLAKQPASSTLVLFVLVFANGIELVGQEDEAIYRLGLREAIALSLAKNFTVRIDRLNPDKEEERIQRSMGVFDPVLTLSGGIDSDEIPDTEGADRQEFVSVSIDGILPWGSRYSVSVQEDNRDQSFLAHAAGANGSATIRVTQPLLRNFGKAANYTGVLISEKRFEQSKYSLRATIMRTVADTIRAYNGMHFAKRNLDIAITNRNLAEKLVTDNNRRLEVGTISEADKMVAETRFAFRKETVLIAETRLREQENAMKQLISDSMEDVLDLRIEVAPLEKPKFYPVDVRQDLKQAIQMRPDFQSALLDNDMNRLELERDRRLRLPNLALVGRLDYAAKGNSFGDGIGNLGGDSADSYSIQTVFSMPIPNRGDRAQYMISEINLKQSEIGLEQMKQIILVRLDNAARRVISSWQRIDAAREARLLAEKSLEAEEKKLNLGVSRSFFVLELQGDLANAQIRETRAITDYNIAVAEYELEKGTILEKYNISSYE